MILAIDAATKTGWALIKSGMVYESGVQDFGKKRGESNGIMFIRFRKWLGKMISDCNPALIVYEQPQRFKSGAASEIAYNLTGRIQEIAHETFVEYATYTPKALKKFATGNGNADKPAMVTACERKSGKAVTDHNEADAILLGLMAYEEYGVE